jgi:protoporphyrinogen IX oxidase
MAYTWFKAFHIVGFVVWFAGLFYLVRLFVYHAEAQEQPEPARGILSAQYELMEKRLYGIIMTPGMMVTLAMATAMVSTAPELLQQTWLHVKLGLVLCLVGYHHYCKRLMKQFAAGENTFTGQQFRWMNEVPTIFLVVIVMLATFKNNIPTSATGYVVVAMVIAFAASIQLYARKRRLDSEAVSQAMAAVTARAE